MDTTQSEELNAWKRETRAYLVKDVDAAIEFALKELERIDFMWGRIRLSRLTTTPTIKADVRVEGHLVVYTNLEVKLAKLSRNTPLSATLHQYCVLNQILEFHAIIQQQLSRLETLKKFVLNQRNDMTDDVPSHEDINMYIDVVYKAHQSLSRICQDLRNAGDVLRLPSRRRFPYCSQVDHTFKPQLPPELIVDYSIHRGELLLEAFVVVATQKPITNIPDGCSSKKEFMGCVCAFRGQKMEIMEYASILVPIPQVEEMLSHLDEQVVELVHVRDNVKALLDCQHI